MNPIENRRKYSGLWCGMVLYSDISGVLAAAFSTPKVLKAGQRVTSQQWSPSSNIGTQCGALDPILPASLMLLSSVGSPESEPVLGKPGSDSGRVSPELLQGQASS